MNHTHPLLLLVGSFAVALPNLLDAQSPDRGAGPPDHWIELFERADTNQDGSLSQAEFEAAVANRPRPPRRDTERPRLERRRSDEGPSRDRRSSGPRGGEHRIDRHHHRHRGGPPKPGTILPRPVIDHLQLSDQQREELESLQSEVDAKMDEILTSEQQERLRRMPPPPPRRGRGDHDKDDRRHDRRPPPPPRD